MSAVLRYRHEGARPPIRHSRRRQPARKSIDEAAADNVRHRGPGDDLWTRNGLASLLGTLGYDIRRNNMHEARLKGILVQTPTEYQVTEGLKEKAPLVQVIESERDLDAAIERWGLPKQSEIREKAGRWPDLRVYAAGDMMYFIYFDRDRVMRDYVYVSI